MAITLQEYFIQIFLGLNSNNSNNLIVAEGKIRIPFNLRSGLHWFPRERSFNRPPPKLYRKKMTENGLENRFENRIRRRIERKDERLARNYEYMYLSGKHTFFDHFSAYASVSLLNGFEDSSRKVLLEDVEVEESTPFDESTEDFETDNFNLLVNNNLDAGLQVVPYSYEWKGANTFLHFRYGIRFLRTGIEYNLVEKDTTNSEMETPPNVLETRDFQVYSLGQEAELLIEMRPQSAVGIDLILGVSWLGRTGTNKNDVNFKTSNNTANLKAIANIYAFLSPEDSKSGVSVKLGIQYNTGNYRIFPQLMVGYATNLTSFVNKFKKD